MHASADGATPDSKGALTLDDLLHEESLAGVVLAGGQHTDRTVRWCVPLPDDDSAFRRAEDFSQALIYAPAKRLAGPDGSLLLGRLATLKVAAVMVARESSLLLARAPGTEPDLRSAMQAAEQRGVPLVQVAAECTYRQVSELVATKILANRLHVLEYRNRVHRSLGDIFGRGAGLDALLREMQRLTGAQVYLVDADGRIVSRTPGPIAVAPETVAEVLAQTLVPRTAVIPGHSHVEVARTSLSADGLDLAILSVPLTTVDVVDGVLALVDHADQDAPHRRAQRQAVLQEARSLVSGELLRLRTAREAHERARNDFVQALLQGRFIDRSELVQRAQHHRFDLEGWYGVAVLRSRGLYDTDGRESELYARLLRALRSIVPAGEEQRPLVAASGMMVAIVLPVLKPEESTVTGSAQQVRQRAEEFSRVAAKILPHEVLISHSGAHFGAHGVARAYREARTALSLAMRMGREDLTSYADLRVFAALREVSNSRAAVEFAESLLSPLRQEGGTDLEEIIFAYLQESGNLNAAARRLHLHRNTLLYKLERISRVLGMNVRDSETQFMVWLAHHIALLNQVGEQLDEEQSLAE